MAGRGRETSPGVASGLLAHRTFRELVKFGLVGATGFIINVACSRSACASSTCITGWPTSSRSASRSRTTSSGIACGRSAHQRDDSHVAMQGARFFAVSLLAAAGGLRAARGLRARRRCPRSRPRCSRSRSSCRSRSSATSTGRSASRVWGELPSWPPPCSCSSRCRSVARADVSGRAIAIAKEQPGGRALLLAHPDARFTVRRAGANWLVLARAGVPGDAARELGDRSRERARSWASRRPGASAASRTPRRSASRCAIRRSPTG